MIINLQPTPSTKHPPTIAHHDFPDIRYGDAFTTVTLTIGTDTITIFLPAGGRLTYAPAPTP